MKKVFFIVAIYLYSSIYVFSQNYSGIDDLLKSGGTKLVEALSEGCLSKVDSLLNLGANPNLPDKNGNSPLFYCAWNDDIFSAKLLLTKGANVNFANPVNGATVLLQASFYASDDLVLLLLNNTAIVDIVTKDNLTPLYVSLILKRFKTADILLIHGADPNSVICGEPLLCTTITDLKDTLATKLLIKHSAKTDVVIQKKDCTPKNSQVGKNALQLAEDKKQFLEILKMKPASITSDFLNKEKDLPNGKIIISTTGHIVKIEDNRILFEVSKGNIKVLNFTNKTAFQKKVGQTFVDLNGPTQLLGFPIVTVNYDEELKIILKMYEGGAFFTGPLQTH